ncbi:SymE family type I addiction module toxin [Dyadobacter endophyticus]|uniref:SymE family type I addiction module toxin n=1 Tax=Dyadobacter endophyticus TaxID=1749036 RepID=UPI003CF5D877
MLSNAISEFNQPSKRAAYGLKNIVLHHFYYFISYVIDVKQYFMTHEKKFLHPSKRTLTVYRKYLPRAYKYAIMPEIRLCGRWLQEAGFECGDEVTVKCLGNKLEITLNPVDEPEPAPVKKRRAPQKEVGW